MHFQRKGSLYVPDRRILPPPPGERYRRYVERYRQPRLAPPVVGTVVATAAPSMVGGVATMSGTNPAGVNRGLPVDVMVFYSSAPLAPDSVTFNGVSMGSPLANVTAITGEILHLRYYLTAPATGAHDVVVDCTTGAARLLAVWIAATPLEDVDQTTPHNTSVSAVWDQVNPNTNFDVTDPNSVAGCLELDSALGIRGGVYPIIAPNVPVQTETFNLAGDPTFALAGSTKPGATNVNMLYGATSGSGGVAWSIITTCFNPVGAAPGTPSGSLFFDDEED